MKNVQISTFFIGMTEMDAGITIMRTPFQTR